MLRKDKAITDREILDVIIHNSEICHLACCLNGFPYLIPISFGYDGQSVYFHTAANGKKVEILSRNPQVCLAFENHVKLIKNPDHACDWSFEFSSAIIKGEAKQIESRQEKNYALNQIMLHYSGKSWLMPEKEVIKTLVWSVSIREITGKGKLPG